MICLDTQILIWGVRGYASVGQEEQVERARRYLHWLKRKNRRIMVPAPVLAEYLVNATPVELQTGEVFEMGFQIPPFDLPAARIAAELARDKSGFKQVAKDYDVSKQCLKVDLMILAIAIHRGAEKVISNDREMLRELIKDRIQVGPLPDVPDEEQLGFSFDDRGS